ncbi:hypothetical protein GCM10010987_59570 [Bradyrhizobium guangdongense]|uniref:Uncharacterized protein n=1 Tax=Bradyrhizobium guangdongense TaxID=1325090 RepID=A0AA88BBC9_9BRAD|nr:hypothetical protein GCM10010987_59570 [Bradyrhizobium guangdongense]
MQRRRAAVPGDAARRPPAASQAVFQPWARPQPALHPDGREAPQRRREPGLASESGLQLAGRPDVRAPASGCQLVPAWQPELVPLRPAERRGALGSQSAWAWVSA